MAEHTNTLVDADWLARHIDRCLILDCRATLGVPGQGRQEYLQNHIAGAVFADIDVDLADPPDHRGRHPLPARKHWITTLQGWGLQPNQQVVVYDDAGGAFAARAWWMLLWAGHSQVAVLDGGWRAWLGSYPNHCDQIEPTTAASTYEPDPPLVQTMSTGQILDNVNDQNLVLIDARTHARWAGQEEPIDPVAGHIPGALCLPFQENLTTEGRFRSPDELRERFSELDPDKTWVSYCGSGVTAAHNILAMHIAGITNVTLYPESWSGWITDPERPIECS